MAITVNGGVVKRLLSHRSGAAIQVQNASEPELAARALRLARSDIAELDGGWQSAPGLEPGDRNGPTYVSDVITVPSGPILVLDAAYTPDALIATIPDLVVRRLEEEGVRRAVVAAPTFKDTPLSGGREGPVLDRLPRAAMLHVYRMPVPFNAPRSERWHVPPPWLEAATAWLLNEQSGIDELWMCCAQGIFPAARADVAGALGQLRRSGSGYLVAGDVGTTIRVIYGEFIGPPKLVLGGGGPGSSDAELLATATELADIARGLAPTVACAFVSIRPTFLPLQLLTDRLTPPRKAGSLDTIGDEVLHDGFPFHILGPGHVHRLTEGGTLRSTNPPAVLAPLGGDRYELAIGSFEDWLLDSPKRAGVQEAARRILAPCLLSRDEERELGRARQQAES